MPYKNLVEEVDFHGCVFEVIVKTSKERAKENRLLKNNFWKKVQFKTMDDFMKDYPQ